MLTGGAVGGTAVGDGVGGAVGEGVGGGGVGVGGRAVGDGVGGGGVGVPVCAKLVAPPKDSMAMIAITTTAIDRVIRITRYSLYSHDSQQSPPLTETG